MAIVHYVMDGNTYHSITLPNIVKIVFGQVHFMVWKLHSISCCIWRYPNEGFLTNHIGKYSLTMNKIRSFMNWFKSKPSGLQGLICLKKNTMIEIASAIFLFLPFLLNISNFINYLHLLFVVQTIGWKHVHHQYVFSCSMWCWVKDFKTVIFLDQVLFLLEDA